MTRSGIFLAGLVLVAGACASSASAPVRTATGSRNVITQDEIRAAAAPNALQVVRAVRPLWLRKRGPQSVSYDTDIIVYLDGARVGGIPALSEISAGNVTSMEFLDAAAANYRFGAGHPYGAILVSTD